MANQYLISIHDYISSKIDGAQKEKKATRQGEGSSRISYLEGQLDELRSLRRFLKQHFDLPSQRYY